MIYLALLAILLAFPVEGFVIQKLWQWFIAPTFFIPELNLVVAMGLALVVSLLTHQVDRKVMSKEDPEEIFKNCCTILLRPLAYLLFGYIFTLFM